MIVLCWVFINVFITIEIRVVFHSFLLKIFRKSVDKNIRWVYNINMKGGNNIMIKIIKKLKITEIEIDLNIVIFKIKIKLTKSL